jgi:signal transduction histidine kinase
MSEKSKVRILVIEDEGIVAIDLEMRLADLGYHVVATVPSAEAAFDLLNIETVDLILMDIHLQGQMDGIAAAARIKQKKDIPIIFVSAYTDDETLKKAMETEPFGYILKPFSERSLQVSIEIALYKHRMETDLKESYRQLALEKNQLAYRVEERTKELSIANAELAYANRQKDEFLANMSHELRTPLNSILGMSEMLLEEIIGALTDNQVKAIRGIQESGQLLLSLITDILDVSKIEAGKLDLLVQPINIEATSNSALRFVKQLAAKKKQHLEFDCPSNFEPMLADERRLKQILVNLLNNAVKFTPENGCITFTVFADPDRQNICFKIEDNGIGMEKTHMERIFEPFMQIDSSLSRRHAGTGLGLALVQRLVKLHNGSITVESEPKKGSTFTVKIPWLKTPPSGNTVLMGDNYQNYGAESVQMRISTPKLKRTILLAEDNQANIDTLLPYLKVKGYEVIIANNGREAVQSAVRHTPDLILMDIQMPDMDGLEAIGLLKKEVSTVRIPIIALTALVMPGDRERCLRAGADEYMSKPFSLRDLVECIEKLCAGTPGA